MSVVDWLHAGVMKRPGKFFDDAEESRNGLQALHGNCCGYLFVSGALDNVYNLLFGHEGNRTPEQVYSASRVSNLRWFRTCLVCVLAPISATV